MASAPHPAALCPLVKAGEGRWGHEHLAPPPPPQSPWHPHPRQDVLAPGIQRGMRPGVSPRSPAPGLGGGDVPQAGTCHPVTRRTPCPWPRGNPGSPQSFVGSLGRGVRICPANPPRVVCTPEGAGAGVRVRDLSEGWTQESPSPEPRSGVSLAGGDTGWPGGHGVAGVVSVGLERPSEQLLPARGSEVWVHFKPFGFSSTT